MKRKIAGILLTAVLAVTAAGFGAAGVSADEAQPDTEAAAEAEISDSEESELPDTEAEADTEAETAAEEDVESISEEDTEEDVKSESTEEETEVTGMKVVLVNDLETDLSAIEVKNFSSDEYSENLLKNDSIFKAGETCTIGIPETVQDPDLNMYDVRITSTDGQITEIPLVPFIEDVTGTLCTEEGTVLIQIRDERLEAEEDTSSISEINQKEEQASEARSEALAADVAADY